MASSTFINKKSQVWCFDILIAILIFFGALIAFYLYSTNMVDIGNKGADSLLLDAKLISSYLLSSGYPEDWAVDNVTLIGLTDGGVVLDSQKVSQFSDISLSDYAQSRKLLSAMHNYYIAFRDKEGAPFRIGGVSAVGKNYTAENPQNLIKVIRFAAYNSTIIRLEVYVW